MKKHVFALFALIIVSSFFGQSSESDDCYEIKYLDFFVPDSSENIKWPDSEINALLQQDYSQDHIHSEIKTNFIIPLIISQLSEYYPTCNAEPDTVYFNKLTDLYFKIRAIDSVGFPLKSIADKIDFLRNDFYAQVENPDNLPYMIFTMDDGPFYGVDYQGKLDLQILSKQKTNFGYIIAARGSDYVVLSGYKDNGDLLWEKRMTGQSDRNLTSLNFADKPVDYTSVATLVNMFSDGERLTLYLKNNGEFLFYFHSW